MSIDSAVVSSTSLEEWYLELHFLLFHGRVSQGIINYLNTGVTQGLGECFSSSITYSPVLIRYLSLRSFRATYEQAVQHQESYVTVQS
ncbi:hypothetical protein BTUL_0144g00140 [Botrytis tulipae]|uniref:Uncharacterized protein n=1 Tax=Botrytis tulipae TaxID=87230 RepID=A0A4Z1EF33_9HELO|nr:hypothetical protein BTUL_0144g00140 [Botrytis tulipae]